VATSGAALLAKNAVDKLRRELISHALVVTPNLPEAAALTGASLARNECRLLRIVALDDLAGRSLDCHIVFGQVVGVHIDDRFVRDGRLDTAAMRPVARCGYDEYAVVESVFSMRRPTA
ncbi:MAG TPA: bifunctional hydroxymethylpyrimidine kinase/phosphomethylpyrimidine kinase, partial [Pseudolabrys sp.]|nr:bifunctional hydroxymethylpyrimidine kinase/phosphomethylpyrimidine kinase [Pseudolabrys sp.]